jgi:hypothetical protein
LYVCKKNINFATKILAMLLGILFSILTATYSLVSTKEVQATGELPPHSSAQYHTTATTGEKGQMTAGKRTELVLQGYDGCKIVAIELMMHSNMSSGAGSLHVQIGDRIVWQIDDASFSSSSWAGAYSKDWVSLRRDVAHCVGENESLVLKIEASVNSLYIASYTIYYEAAPERCFRVDFQTGMEERPASLEQESVGATLVLPAWKDTLEWRFLGWAEAALDTGNDVLEYKEAGSAFVPQKDCVLWALYTDAEDALSVQEYVSGHYVLGMINAYTETMFGKGMGAVLCGGVKDGKIAIKGMRMQETSGGWQLLDKIESGMLYCVDIEGDVLLKVRHNDSGTCLGYADDRLGMVDCSWQYRSLDDGSMVLYYLMGGKQYALYVGQGIDGNWLQPAGYAQPMMVEAWKTNGWWWFDAKVARYTSWPLGWWDAVEDVVAKEIGEKVVFRWGLYEIVVENGRKMLRIL